MIVVFVMSIVLSPFSGALAADGAHITLTSNVPTTTVSVAAGQQYSLDLTTCFNEPNSAHTLTYSLTGNNLGPHTKIAADTHNSNHQTFFFSVQNAGYYSVTITATCSDGDSASFILPIEVTSATPASSAQINYDETSDDSVTVYVTVSNDGMPIKGSDGTVLANKQITVPYFDLDVYGLSEYYRYPSTGGDVIERPTLLHLYIYLHERYYMGLSEDSCATGESGILTYNTPKSVQYMDNETAYNSGSNNALSLSGSAGSLYMTTFWGHNENLMYFRNHVFPLMSAGWGATADYILLSDGDYIDLAMFSNWDFYSTGAFLCFNSDAFVAQTGTPINFAAMQYPTSAYFGMPVSLVAMTDELDVDIYNSNWVKVADLAYTANSNVYSYTFCSTGTYYIVAKDLNAEGSYAVYAPAVAIITVN